MELRSVCAVGLLWLAHGTASAAGPHPVSVGSEFQVNTYTTDDQEFPSVAAVADGDFVVVWHSHGSGSDTSLTSIQSQRYASDGTAIGGPFQINTYTTHHQVNPFVAADADGNFVVVWRNLPPTAGQNHSLRIDGQRYASDGTALGSQFQVSAHTTASISDPVVAVDADGDFVVVWPSMASTGDDTSSWSIQAQRYDSAGSALGSQFQVNTNTTGPQYQVSASADADGGFVVVWHSEGWSGDFTIEGQRYDSAGGVAGNQFQVAGNSSFQPFVSAGAQGGFVVVWNEASGYAIQGRRFDSAGIAVGSPFQANTYTTGDPSDPSVAVDADGGFVVAWHVRRSEELPGSDTTDASIHARRYDSSGNAVAGQFQVNTYTTRNQRAPSLVAQPTGDFVVVWHSQGSSGSDTSSFSVQGQRFTMVTPVPSLSPAGLAAAALLVCLAALVALRRA